MEPRPSKAAKRAIRYLVKVFDKRPELFEEGSLDVSDIYVAYMAGVISQHEFEVLTGKWLSMHRDFYSQKVDALTSELVDRRWVRRGQLVLGLLTPSVPYTLRLTSDGIDYGHRRWYHRMFDTLREHLVIALFFAIVVALVLDFLVGGPVSQWVKRLLP